MHGEVAFRGQLDASWDLIPSAFRANAPIHIDDWTANESGISPIVQSHREHRAVLEFVNLADSVGLEIPGDISMFRELEDRKGATHNSYWRDTWPAAEMLETLAIAQHHGVVTRLLDFTFEPSVAALFAAKDAWCWANSPSVPESAVAGARFAIWAIDLRFIRHARLVRDASLPRLKEILVPRADNRYLHAQHGLFLLDEGASHSWQDGSSPSLERVIRSLVSRLDNRVSFWTEAVTREMLLPVTTKFEAPVGIAANVLRLLRNQGITQAHLEPSYGGVVSAIKLMRQVDDTE